MPKHGGIKPNAYWPVCSIMLNFSNDRYESVHKHGFLDQSIDHQNNTMQMPFAIPFIIIIIFTWVKMRGVVHECVRDSVSCDLVPMTFMQQLWLLCKWCHVLTWKDQSSRALLLSLVLVTGPLSRVFPYPRLCMWPMRRWMDDVRLRRKKKRRSAIRG